jgi:hypothetical protein
MTELEHGVTRFPHNLPFQHINPHALTLVHQSLHCFQMIRQDRHP